MTKEVVIKKLEDLKEYCSEQVGMYDKESEWRGDVKALEVAIDILKGTAQEVKFQEQFNFNPTTGKKISDNCTCCWVMKKENYNCGYDNCPGYKLLIKNITHQK